MHVVHLTSPEWVKEVFELIQLVAFDVIDEHGLLELVVEQLGSIHNSILCARHQNKLLSIDQVYLDMLYILFWCPCVACPHRNIGDNLLVAIACMVSLVS